MPLPASSGQASPNVSTIVSLRPAAVCIVVDESKGLVDLAAAYWINPKSGRY